MIHLNILLFGGRGASSLSKIPKNKRKAIQTYKKRIKEHKQKINDAKRTGKNTMYINHWENEIKTFENNIKKIIDRRDRK